MNETKISVNKTWTDDHLPCAEVTVNDKTVNLLWTDNETLAALRYADESPRAAALVAPLVTAILAWVPDDEDDDNGQTEWGMIDKADYKDPEARCSGCGNRNRLCTC